jgi:3-deoxy-manno-octulosonate cytidylyltransferase (CMP-KDO synthetase)
MNIVGIIPARMAASRFPNKPLKMILGMPMLGHCYYRTKLVEMLSDVYIATCDQEIYDYAKTIGGNPIMTSNTHTRATTRTCEALHSIEEKNEKKIDIVLMVQGDEPLIQPNAISEALEHFRNEHVQIVNIMSKFWSIEEFMDKNNVKVVVDKNGDSLYFSREAIPSPWKSTPNLPMFMQTGIIAFRREALIRFMNLPESDLEKIESIDMNRVIENGEKIRMHLINQYTLGVDTQKELLIAESILRKDETTFLYLRS